MYGLLNIATGPYSTIATILLFVDAYIGAWIFVTENDLSQYVGYFEKNALRTNQVSGEGDGNRDNQFFKI